MAVHRNGTLPKGTVDEVASFGEDGDTAETAALDPTPAIQPEGERPDFAAPTLADPELLALVKLGLAHGPTTEADDTDTSLRPPRDTDEHPASSDPTITTPAIRTDSNEAPVFGDPTIATPAIHAQMAAHLKAPTLRKPAPTPAPRPSFDDPTYLDPHLPELHRPDFAGPTIAGAVTFHSPAKTDEDLPAQPEPAAKKDPSLKLTAIRRSAIPVAEAPTAPPTPAPEGSRGYKMHVLREDAPTRRSVPPPGPQSRPRASVAQKPPSSRTSMLIAIMVSIIAILVLGIALSVALR
ncbi:MAG: hypothetical protein HY791_01500 [Deltaproteobacteria bacterium]|nr:hypothetical protein [Deltaproteobacteria bacterium]